MTLTVAEHVDQVGFCPIHLNLGCPVHLITCDLLSHGIAWGAAKRCSCGEQARNREHVAYDAIVLRARATLPPVHNLPIIPNRQEAAVPFTDPRVPDTATRMMRYKVIQTREVEVVVEADPWSGPGLAVRKAQTQRDPLLQWTTTELEVRHVGEPG